MRLLWWSNAPWAGTGYGTQTAQATRRIKAAGHEVVISNNYGLQATQGGWEGIPVLNTGFHPHSIDTLLSHAEHERADWTITLYDVWVFQPRAQFADMRIASWVPVDSDPIPPEVLAWCREHFSIAMSQYGQQQLRANGVDARYVPHAIERDVYRPTPSDLRARIGVPDDAFVVFVNAANKGKPARKAWPEMLDAFAQFSRRHDDAYLFLNTDLAGTVDGVPLPHIMTLNGIRPERVRVTPAFDYLNHRVSPQQVAAMYTASDVLLSTSMGEGFGLSVIEAQACGTPVIVTDFTAQPELVGAGWKVGYQRWYHPGQGTYWATPHIPEILEALEMAYEARGEESLRERAIEFAAEYDADTVFARYWTPVLAEMEELLRPPVPRNVRRAERRKKGRKAA